MTNKEILIAISSKVGDYGMFLTTFPNDQWEEKNYFPYIFSHDFAKKFFGKRIIAGYNVNYWLYSSSYPEPGYDCEASWMAYDYIKADELEKWKTRYKNIPEFTNGYDFQYKPVYDEKSGWKYHLQQMVLEENPLQYLSQFLK